MRFLLFGYKYIVSIFFIFCRYIFIPSSIYYNIIHIPFHYDAIRFLARHCTHIVSFYGPNLTNLPLPQRIITKRLSLVRINGKTEEENCLNK